LKCDDKEEVRPAPFKPESPFVIVCEGFQDAGLFCALLEHLKITNCDVTFPKKKRDGANGESGIPEMVRLLSEEQTVSGIAIMRDADENADDSFAKAQAAFTGQFTAPKDCFVVSRGKHKTTAVFLMPGRGLTGGLEALLLKAVFASHPELDTCISSLESCHKITALWSDKKKAKMRMQCVIASFCKADPGCSLAFIWKKGKDNPIDLASDAFKELSDFLVEFTATPAAPAL
jgi:hypothetical protein